MAVSAVVVTAAVLMVAAFAFIAEANRAGPSPTGAIFVVPDGSRARDVADDLQHFGQIRSQLMFRAALRVYARGKLLRAGEYEIPRNASVRQIVLLLANGQAVMHAVTIPEGYTSAQVVKTLMDSPVLTGDIAAIPPEGSLLPETYNVSRGMTREAVLKQMRDAHDAALADIWAHRAPNLPISTPEELVTLASIVEKETGVANERAQVAAVYVNRLRKPMRLESDPTIIYGISKGEPLLNAAGQRRTLRRSELDDAHNPYNTYQHDGLPPGPIANPGRAALEAAANPAQTEDLFFVADGTGGHVFSATLAEHNANVARWRGIERARIADERRH
jgi:peptidoglycan lytic transglycosylase G